LEKKVPVITISKPGLERSVSFYEAVFYGLGVIFGAGIYALIGEAAGIAGNLVWLSFVVAAAVASLTALSYCELSSMFPKSAAEYTYVKNAFKNKLFGFLMGWISLFAAMISVSAVSIGFAGYFSLLFPLPLPIVAISLIALLSIVNFLGVKESAKLNTVLTVVATIGLVLIIFMALPFFGTVDYLESVVPNAPLPSALNSVAIAAALIFFAYIGFEDIANLSEETVNAKKSVPKAILVALVISTILYILVSLSVVSIVPWQELSVSAAPIALVAGTAFGPTAATIFSIIALFATASTVLIILMAVSRMLYGISLDGSLPGFISKVHSKTRTPFVSIALTSVFAMFFVLVGDLKHVAFITNFGVFSMFLMVNLSVIILRFTNSEDERTFRIPCNMGKMPVFSLLGVFASLFMLSRIEFSAAVFAIVAILLGIPAYYLFNALKRH